ncbi:MAG: TetR/AcrR family transcriptional regulator [Salibacteraceae bacterium]
MAKKKNISADNIRDSFMDYLLNHGEHPKSVYAFSKILGIDESLFYEHYASFEIIERIVFQSFYDNTVALLEENKEYHSFDPQNKLLSFYFTFFEILKANRSYVLMVLKQNKNQLKALQSLAELRTSFLKFIEQLELDSMDLKVPQLEDIKEKAILEGSWAQFLFTLKFWLDDSSANFEKTDLLIEKSISTSFALMDNQTFNSVFDLGKFLFKEAMGKK